ncbi:hypothetical protein Y1Q_0021744 [Alligator mississippiensis]|uniref:Uncharacterized protein n=1 Tax=Alligator mississippiensis TaxID=8496 RepID=A0A151PB42_ALLMI|nr:hypothetical protein Y1Q_0021744 [Alligator mississippiensis]
MEPQLRIQSKGVHKARVNLRTGVFPAEDPEEGLKGKNLQSQAKTGPWKGVPKRGTRTPCGAEKVTTGSTETWL